MERIHTPDYGRCCQHVGKSCGNNIVASISSLCHAPWTDDDGCVLFNQVNHDGHSLSWLVVSACTSVIADLCSRFRHGCCSGIAAIYSEMLLKSDASVSFMLQGLLDYCC
jgi:hypothetical protein